MRKALAVLSLLASSASAQLLKSEVSQVPAPPFETTRLASLTAPSAGTYLVIGNATLEGGWLGYTAGVSVKTDAPGMVWLCSQSATFGLLGPGPILAHGSCSALTVLPAGASVWLEVYHESGDGVNTSAQTERTSLALLLLSPKVVSRLIDAR